MKKTVLTFGLIAGAIVSFFMVLALVFKDAIGFDRGEIVGYTSMVVAFLFIYFGVRAYRDNVGGGTVSFGRGVAVGSLIAVLASACYLGGDLLQLHSRLHREVSRACDLEGARRW